jgi:hypothetical protein
MSPSSQTYVAPAPLRHVVGFPDLGLLRELRPHASPSPDFEGLADPLPTGGCARVPTFRSTTHGPVDGLLYPGMLCPRATTRCSRPCRRRDMPRPVQSADPDRAPCSPLSRCESSTILFRGFKHRLRIPHHRSCGSPAWARQRPYRTVETALRISSRVSNRTRDLRSPFDSAHLKVRQLL